MVCFNATLQHLQGRIEVESCSLQTAGPLFPSMSFSGEHYEYGVFITATNNPDQGG